MRGTRAAMLIICALAIFAAPAAAEETVKLFNGENLDGWTYYLRDAEAEMDDVWSVDDGVIHCVGKPVGYLRTEEKYTNYKLKVEWRWPADSKPGNSGVLLRVVGEDKVWPKSIEAQLMNKNAGDIWNIGEFPMTADADRTKGRRTAKMHETNEKDQGEWNVYEITMDGGKLELKVNGLVQNAAGDCEEVPGYIALQSEGAAIEFRAVELTPLD